jgi:type IV secretion system protein VirB10
MSEDEVEIEKSAERYIFNDNDTGSNVSKESEPKESAPPQKEKKPVKEKVHKEKPAQNISEIDNEYQSFETGTTDEAEYDKSFFAGEENIPELPSQKIEPDVQHDESDTVEELEALEPAEEVEDITDRKPEIPKELPRETHIEEAPNPALDDMSAPYENQNQAQSESDNYYNTRKETDINRDTGKKGIHELNKNKAKQLNRSKLITTLVAIVGGFITIFLIAPNIKGKVKETVDMNKAGHVYIPDDVKRDNTPPISTPVYIPDDIDEDELLRNLEQRMEDERISPALAAQESTQTTRTGSNYAQPTTNTNPLQKSISRMPWNGGTSQPANTGNPISQAIPGILSPQEYMAQLQNRSASLGASNAPNMTGFPGQNENSYANNYLEQNMQTNKESFANNGSGATGNYRWNNEYSIFQGTIIPAVLETGLNSDLPGAVIARVTKNIYSSLNGRYLLIPEGSRLYATYNSNISYNQRRVQIAWTNLIRPDGFEIALGNMQGVDLQGFTGQRGDISEHYFSYLKAMGIVSMFSIMNGEIDSTMQSLGATSYADQLVSENRQVINQLSGKLLERALDIQPTIRVKQGTPINILTNTSIDLPPLEPYTATQKYIRQ